MSNQTMIIKTALNNDKTSDDSTVKMPGDFTGKLADESQRQMESHMNRSITVDSAKTEDSPRSIESSPLSDSTELPEPTGGELDDSTVFRAFDDFTDIPAPPSAYWQKVIQYVDMDWVNEFLAQRGDLSTAGLQLMDRWKTNPILPLVGAMMLVKDHHLKIISRWGRLSFSNGTARMNERSMLDSKYTDFVQTNAAELDSMIDYSLDYYLNGHGFLLQRYLYEMQLSDGTSFETYQDVLAREAVWLHMDRESSKTQGSYQPRAQDESLTLCDVTPAAGGLDEIKRTYMMMSAGHFTHASPTKFNSALRGRRAQLSSCFLIGTDDKMDSMIWALEQAAKALASGGGIGASVSYIRSSAELVGNGPGHAQGVVNFNRQMHKVANNINQGRRPGSTTNYVDTIHRAALNILLKMSNNDSKPEDYCHKLNMCMMLRDDFLQAVTDGTEWHTWEPNWYPQLFYKFNDEFRTLQAEAIKDIACLDQILERLPKKPTDDEIMNAAYELLELESFATQANNDDCSARKTFSRLYSLVTAEFSCAHDVICCMRRYSAAHVVTDPRYMMSEINRISKLTGRVFIMYIDTVNRSNMADNRGPVLHSNLCTEIMQPNFPQQEVATCCVGTVNAQSGLVKKNDTTTPNSYTPSIVFDFTMDDPTLTFQWPRFINAARQILRDLQRVVDITVAPTEEAWRSIVLNRDTGIGLNGVYDTMIRLGIQMDSSKGINFGAQIAMWTNLAVVTESAQMARQRWKNIRAELRRRQKAIDQELAAQALSAEDAVIHITPRKAEIELTHYRNPARIPGAENLSNEEYETKYSAEDRQRHLELPIAERYSTYKVTYTLDTLPKSIGAYPAFLWNGGSAISRGEFHMDRVKTPITDEYVFALGGQAALDTLTTARSLCQTFGTRGCLMLAPPPTLSTAAVLRTTPSFEVPQVNVARQQTLLGTTSQFNDYMAFALADQWSPEIAQYLTERRFSVQENSENGISPPYRLSRKHRLLLRNAFEMRQSRRVDMAAAMQPFIDQAISLNRYMDDPNNPQMTGIIMHGWKSGIKTLYYMFTGPATLGASVDSGSMKSSQHRYTAEAVEDSDDTSSDLPVLDSLGCIGCT